MVSEIQRVSRLISDMVLTYKILNGLVDVNAIYIGYIGYILFISSYIPI